jgi:hypothetical protein
METPYEIEELGCCPLCDRPMIAGSSINKHHLVPKTFSGRETIWLHRVCHNKIHSVFTERELLKTYHTVAQLRAHPEIDRFVSWLKNKDPEFKTSSARPRSRRR